MCRAIKLFSLALTLLTSTFVGAQARLNMEPGNFAALGAWLSIDQTVRTHPTGGGGFEVKGGRLWICDVSGVLPTGDDVEIRLFGRRLSHQQGKPTGDVFGQQLQRIPLAKGAYSCNAPPASPTAVFDPYVNSYDVHELPDFTWRVGVEIVAARSKFLGIQARTMDSCQGGPITAWPGSPNVSRIEFNNWEGFGRCRLELRLCTIAGHPLHSDSTSCSVK